MSIRAKNTTEDWEQFRYLMIFDEKPEYFGANTEPAVCKYFGCGKTLTPQEQLFGDRCAAHSIKKPTIDAADFVSY